jgi:hypothetical protein
MLMRGPSRLSADRVPVWRASCRLRTSLCETDKPVGDRIERAIKRDGVES